MKFATESKMKTWRQAIELQRKKLAQPVPEPKEFPNPDSVTLPPLPQAPLPRNLQNYYQAKWPADLAGRSVRPPPAMALNSSDTSVAQQHSRSYSTPDINAHTGDRSLPINTVNSQIPALPGLTPHQHHPSRSPILIAPPRLGLRPPIKNESDENWL
jgi:hypothetical protein